MRWIWRILTLLQREEEWNIWQKPDQKNRHNIVVDRFWGADMRRVLQVFYTQLTRCCLDIVFFVVKLVVILTADWVYVDRQKYSITNSSTDRLCRCQQQWMGLPFTSPQQHTQNHLWPLGSSRSLNVYQLGRTQGRFSRSEYISLS